MARSEKHERRRRLSIRRHRSRAHAPGSAPGTLRIDPQAPHPTARILAYDGERVIEDKLETAQEVAAEAASEIGNWPTVWIDVAGLGHEATLRALGNVFGIHRLTLEDIVNVGQRSKLEPYDHYLFVVAQMPARQIATATAPLGPPGTEQLSLILGKGFVLTFQERAGDFFSGVRTRLESGNAIRSKGPDYLAYALIDAVIDSYFPVLDHFGDEMDVIEQRILNSSDPAITTEIHALRQYLRELRRAVGPHRETINGLLRDGERWMSEDTRVYLRDSYDHAVRVLEQTESYRDQAADLLNLHLSMISHRMNEVMKVLTIIATIFIPLSFIAGLYGMNFDTSSPWNMPELDWRFGYPFALGLMALLAGGMFVYFWVKGWFR